MCALFTQTISADIPYDDYWWTSTWTTRGTVFILDIIESHLRRTYFLD